VDRELLSAWGSMVGRETEGKQARASRRVGSRPRLGVGSEFTRHRRQCRPACRQPGEQEGVGMGLS
jgi:hypothetical protein